MEILLVALTAAGCVPFLLAIWANRRTSLMHALLWAFLAWLTWGASFLVEDLDAPGMQPARYVAWSLTGCAGVAVLGARRPHVLAWDFVVGGLLAVMALPLLERWLIGTQSLDGLRTFFLAGTVAVGAVNYLPTRFWPAALLLLVAGGLEAAALYAPTSVVAQTNPRALVALIPWAAWAVDGRYVKHSDFDRLWLGFRNRWGFVWGQRVREQFNHAARNAGWPVQLHWHGLAQEGRDPVAEMTLLSTLQAVLQRFL